MAPTKNIDAMKEAMKSLGAGDLAEDAPRTDKKKEKKDKGEKKRKAEEEAAPAVEEPSAKKAKKEKKVRFEILKIFVLGKFVLEFFLSAFWDGHGDLYIMTTVCFRTRII